MGKKAAVISRVRKYFRSAADGIKLPTGLYNALDRVSQTLQQEELPGLALRAWNRLNTRLRLCLLALLIVLPAIIAALYIRTYAVNVVAYDEVEAIPPLYDKLQSGTLSFGDLSAQWNEHRPFFPRVVMLALAVVTHHNNIAACYFSWFLICLICVVLFLAHRRVLGHSQTALAAFIPVSWLLFNPVQGQNLVQGFQIQVFMAVLFFVLSMYLLSTSELRWWRFALSVVSGLVATFSMNNGLLAWPIGLVVILVLLLQSQRGELRRRFLIMGLMWFLVGLAVCLSYYLNYDRLISDFKDFKFAYWTHEPARIVRFFLASMGSLTRSLWSAAIAGLLLLMVYVYAVGSIVLQRASRPSSVFYVSLILFATLTLAGWTLNRAYLGIDQALAERAATIAIIGMTGLYLAATSLQTKYAPVKASLLGFSVSLILLSGVLSYNYAIGESGPSWRSLGRYQAYILSTYSVQSNEMINTVLNPLCPDPELTKEGARLLEKHGLSVFSKPSLKLEELIPLAGATEGRIDSINNVQMGEQYPAIVTVSSEDNTVTIWGWAIDKQAADTAGAVFISIDGKTDVPAFYGMDRPDIAAHFGERCRASGFTASFATAIVPAGQQHTLSLRIVTHDKTGYYEPTQRIVLEIG